MGMGLSTGRARRAIVVLLTAGAVIAGGLVVTDAAPATADTAPDFAVMPDLAEYSELAPRGLAIGDLQGDGKADLVVAYELDNAVITWHGDGTGRFASFRRAVAPGHTRAVAVHDMTGDAIPDLVTVGTDGTEAYVSLGSGGGVFPSYRKTVVGQGGADVAVADFNGDGAPDFVVPLGGTAGASPRVSVALNDGGGRFPTVGALVPSFSPVAVATADLNGDGHVDLAVSNFDAGDVSIFLGNGDGTFLTAPAVRTTSQPLELGIGDFDGDGKPDLAVPSYGSSTVQILLGNGDGTFRNAADIIVGVHPRAVAIADFDGDAKADLAVTVESKDTVSVLFGDGTGAFGRTVTVPVGDRPFDVVAADFDGDARPDLAVSNFGSNTVSIRLNRYSRSLPQATLTVTSTAGTYGKPLPLTVGGGSGTGALTYAVLAGGTATGCAISAAAPFTLSTSSPGTCSVQASKVGDGTYAPAQSPGTTVTIAKASQASLKLVATTVVLPSSIDLVASGGSGTGAVTYALVAGGTATGCTISAAAPFTVSSTSAGTCLVKATKATDATYKAAVSATTTMAFVTTLPVVAIADKTLTEGASGTTSAAFTLTHTGETFGAATVTWATGNQTAVAPQDYVAVPATKLTFAPGATSATVTVKVVADQAVEPDETFTIGLSAPTGATIGDGTAIGTITNDDTALAINDVSVIEGNAGAVAATFTVTRTGVLTGSSSAQWATVTATATAGADFTAVAASAQTPLAFAANEATKQVTVMVTGDTLAEGNESFSVKLSAPVGATLLDSVGLGTITDDDAALSIGDVKVTEGSTGSQVATFTITRTGATAFTSTVLWRTFDGTAQAPADYTAVTTATQVTFAPGVTKQTVPVTILGDTTYEGDENFSVQLSSPTNATIVDGTAVGTIVTDEVGLSIGDVTMLEGASSSAAAFTVTRTGPLGVPVSVYASTVDGTAKAPGDYTAITTPVRVDLPAGVASRTVAVQVVGDTTIEPTESFTVTLTSAAGATIVDGTAVGTVTNDDSTVRIADASVVEGNVGATDMVFTLTRTGATNLQQTASVRIIAGTATASTDYSDPSSSLVTFPVGATTAQVRVPVLGEVAYEDDETFTVNIFATGGSGSLIPTGADAIGTIISDDATIAISDGSVAEGDATTNNQVRFTVARQGALNRAVSFTWATSDLEARAGVNYTAVPPTTVTFAPGEAVKDLYVSVFGNQVPQPDLRFRVTLTSVPWATANNDLQALGTIVNDDAAINLSINDVTLAEGNTGTKAFTFAVTRDNASRAGTVRWETENNTASAPTDFTAVVGGTISFAVGETSKQVTVYVKGDTTFEGTEVFHVRLYQPTGYMGLADDTGTGTILNDD